MPTEQPVIQNLPTPAESTALQKPSPLEELKPLLNADGALELSNLQIGERVQQFIEFREKCNFNLPLWDTAILSQFPPGVALVPVMVLPSKSDAWQGEDAKKMKLKEGHVEPTADFILKLGNIAGVRLEKIFEGINPDTRLWSCRYNAMIQLPNGEWLTIQDEGKDQEAFNNDGSPKAHVSESTRKKAKRNVVKNLLGIPTSLPEAEFNRAWVLLKPVFNPGHADTDRIIAENKAIADKAKAKLYGDAIDVKALAPGEQGVDDVLNLFKNASDLNALEAIAKAAADMPKTESQRKALAQVYTERKAALSGEVKL